jgi:hypothetical protein
MAEATLEICNAFAVMYQRNNKSKIKKNMRCFPRCAEAGHREKGFCGNSIHLNITSSVLSSEELRTCVVLGGLHCDLDEVWCKAGATVENSYLEMLVKNPDVLQGTAVMSSGSFTNQFRISPSNNKGWSYMTNTNKCRGKVCHKFCAVAFVRVPQSSLLKCVGVVNSIRFDVNSAKRQNKASKAEGLEKNDAIKRQRMAGSVKPPVADKMSVNNGSLLQPGGDFSAAVAANTFAALLSSSSPSASEPPPAHMMSPTLQQQIMHQQQQQQHQQQHHQQQQQQQQQQQAQPVLTRTNYLLNGLNAASSAKLHADPASLKQHLGGFKASSTAESTHQEVPAGLRVGVKVDTIQSVCAVFERLAQEASFTIASSTALSTQGHEDPAVQLLFESVRGIDSNTCEEKWRGGGTQGNYLVKHERRGFAWHTDSLPTCLLPPLSLSPPFFSSFCRSTRATGNSTLSSSMRSNG